MYEYSKINTKTKNSHNCFRKYTLAMIILYILLHVCVYRSLLHAFLKAQSHQTISDYFLTMF